jgi:hypothetical protein
MTQESAPNGSGCTTEAQRQRSVLALSFGFAALEHGARLPSARKITWIQALGAFKCPGLTAICPDPRPERGAGTLGALLRALATLLYFVT